MSTAGRPRTYAAFDKQGTVASTADQQDLGAFGDLAFRKHRLQLVDPADRDGFSLKTSAEPSAVSPYFGVRDLTALDASLEPRRDRPTPSVTQMRPVGRSCRHDANGDIGGMVEHRSQHALSFRREQTFACQRFVLRQRDCGLQRRRVDV